MYSIAHRNIITTTSATTTSGSLPEWGVTVLQADEEMDAGDVWKSNNFSVPTSSTLTKSAFYNKVRQKKNVSGICTDSSDCVRLSPFAWLSGSNARVVVRKKNSRSSYLTGWTSRGGIIS